MVSTPRDPTPLPPEQKLQLEVAKLQLELETTRARLRPSRLNLLQVSTLATVVVTAIAVYFGVLAQRLRLELERTQLRVSEQARVEKYLDWATSDHSARERRAAGAYALGSQWDKTSWHDLVIPTLAQLLASDDHEVRAAAADAFGRAFPKGCDKPTALAQRLYGSADGVTTGAVLRVHLDVVDSAGREHLARDLGRLRRLEPLESARLDTVEAIRRGCLRNANLRGADLHGAELRGVALKGADVKDLDLTDANLWEADLSDLRNWTALRGIAGANIGSLAGAPEGFREWAKAHGAIDDLDLEGWTQRTRGRGPGGVRGH